MLLYILEGCVNLKKILAIILAFVLVFTLAGCGKKLSDKTFLATDGMTIASSKINLELLYQLW